MLLQRTNPIRLGCPMSSHAAKVLGRNVKRLRESLALSQAELGKRAGVNPSQIAHIEFGRSFASGAAFDRLAAALGVSLADLLNERDKDGNIQPRPAPTSVHRKPSFSEALKIVNESIDDVVLKKKSKKKASGQ